MVAETLGRFTFSKDPFFKKSPELPVTFSKGKDFAFGTRLHDDFSRLSHDVIKQLPLGNLIIKFKNNGIRKSERQTFSLEIHTYDEQITNFQFYNILRKDVPGVYLNGAIDFFNIFSNEKLLNDKKL